MNSERLLQILRRPHVSESATRVEAKGQYVFRVLKDASKGEIREAVEQLFQVQVRTVRVLNMPSKRRRVSHGYARRPGWKKAYIVLGEGQSIDFANLEKAGLAQEQTASAAEDA